MRATPYWLTAVLLTLLPNTNAASLNHPALRQNIQPYTELQGGPSYDKASSEGINAYTTQAQGELPESANGFNADEYYTPGEYSVQATNGTGGRIGAYYPDWQTNRLPVDQIDWAHIDYVSYAFGLINPSTYEIELSAGSDKTLTSLVQAAHSQTPKKDIELSLGGWTGSEPFSKAVSTDANRQKLAKGMVSAASKWDLDGIDIDWEYPGLPGAGNTHSGDDTANYLKFLKVLRQQLPSNVTISAATSVYPFAGPDGKPLSDLSGFGEIYDHILIMNYDVFNAAPKPGPNAALKDTCGSSKPGANAEDSIKAWNKAGIPLDKIYLGVPAYGC